MVLLRKIYSETDLFDTVEFHDGVNIIQGIYTKKPREKSTDLNGVGKSTLVRLIDYCLLSDTTRQKYFNVNKYNFLSEHQVTLEFEINKQKYLIKRKFTSPNEPEFGKDKNVEKYDVGELRLILGNLFFGADAYEGSFDNKWFRSLMRFFVKDDIDYFERMDPLKFFNIHANDFDAYTYNLFLLDIPNKSVIEYNNFKKKSKDLRNRRVGLISHLEEESGKSMEEIKSEVRFLDEKISSFEKSLSTYEFLDSYKDAEQKIVDITNKVSILLRKLNVLQKKLNEYQKSYDYEIEININEIARAYGETKKIFEETVKNELNDVIAFRKRLSENRMKFIQDKEQALTNEIENIYTKLSFIEKERSNLYMILDEKKALDSIKNTYSQLIQRKTIKERLATSIKQIDDIDKQLYNINKKISKSIEAISKEVNSSDSNISNLHSLFLNNVRNMIHVEDIKKAIFDIRPIPDLRAPLKIAIEVPKSSSLGKNRFRILAYDLTVFFNIIRKSRALPHFLVHDGVFHAIDKKTIVRILNHVYSEFLKYHNFQYIITANDGDLSIPEEKKNVYGQYQFDLAENIVAIYKDIPSEMIFKREY